MKILVICGTNIGKEMTGTAIRCWEMASVLSKIFNVTLAAKEIAGSNVPEFQVIKYNFRNLLKLISSHDVMISQGFNILQLLIAKLFGTRIIYDLYAPVHFEFLERCRGLPKFKQYAINKDLLLSMKLIFLLTDHIICASEKQRDLWLGIISALGICNPGRYIHDPTQRKFIDVVPIGLPENTPLKKKKVLKGVYPGINKDDKVVIWGGGIWDWFDPLVLIKSMSQLVDKHKEVKLFFLGIKHPDPNIPVMSKARETIKLAENLGLKNVSVFFNEKWVPYRERVDYLLEADVGVSFHSEHLETRFAFRTRILDYLWAELPIICSQGDVLADMVREYELGIVTPCGDEDAIVQAIQKVLYDGGFSDRCRKNIKKNKINYTWEHCMAPLVGMCMEQEPIKRLNGVAYIMLLCPVFIIKKISLKVLNIIG